MEKVFSILRGYLEKMPSTLQLQAFGLTQVPLLFLVLPKVEAMDEARAHVRINLNWLTRNHLKSMYFGTLGIGADCVVAVLALHVVKRLKGAKVVPVFKSFEAQFLKRAETDVLFICEEGEKIWTMVQEAHQSGTRVTKDILAKAVNPTNHLDIYAEFKLGLSVRVLDR
jgi:hypothetical protein